LSNKNQPVYDHRLTVGVTAQMNARLDTLADIRNQPKSELAREAIRLWLDHAEDARMSRAFFTKSFQHRIDHLDWQLEVVMQMLITLARKPELLEEAISKALESNRAKVLLNGGMRRAVLQRADPVNRKPPAK
jgi:predicted DNA-binding protein